jgi:hypothetical protein
MKSIKLFNRQAGVLLTAAALVFAMMLPGLASAAQVTERSIELSNSSVSASGVTYKVSFTPVADAEAFLVNFCSNSSVIGQTCTPPTDFTGVGAASTTANFTDVTPGVNKVVVTGSMTAGTPVSVDISGIHNPSIAGPLYARIVSYDSKANATNVANNSTTPGANAVDDGGVIISITPTIGVSASVLESLTFCVSKKTIDANCTNTDAPVLALGETVGDGLALVPTAVSTGQLNTQISTNAAGGAIVRLKSMTNCGGLKRASATTCDIVPALADGITSGQARFGVKTSTATDTASTNANGTYQAAVGSGYNATTYVLNYLANNSSGVTSTFGDPFLDTDSKPVNNKNMALTFGASVSNDTPAGLYATDLSLIATGKF